MADESRDTPNPFEIFGTNTGGTPDPFNIYDTYNLPDPVNSENTEKAFGQEDTGELPIFGLSTNDFTPEENNWIMSLLNAPIEFGRGGARGIARTVPLMGEGVWSLLDLATNLTGQEDWLNPKESAFIDKMDQLRDAIGYEDSVAGRTGEALGSILGFVGTTVATGGVGAAARLAGGYRALKAGETVLGGAKTLGAATQIAAPGMAAGVSEASMRMRDYELETGEDLSIPDRNMALALGIPLGATEVLPIVRPLSMLFSKIRKGDLPQRTLDTYMDYAKSAAITGTAEGAQEALAGIGQDAIAKGVYDEDAVIGESVASEFGYGGGAGAIFDLGVNLLTKGRPRGGRPVTDPSEEGAPETELDDLDAQEEQEAVDESTPRPSTSSVVDEALFGEEEIVLPEDDLTAPVVVEPEAELVIPPNVKAGDIIDMFDALGNPYKATVTAVSQAGNVKVLNQQGQEVVVNLSPTATTNNVNSPDYTFKVGKFQGKKVSELSEEEISESKVILEDSLKDTKNLMNVKGGLNPALLDLNAIKLKEKRKVQPTQEVINATIDTPEAEIEAAAQALKDNETPILDPQEQVETEAIRQQTAKVNPKLQSALDEEVDLEEQIQEAQDKDELNEADKLKTKLNNVQQQTEALIKEEKVPVKRSRTIQTFNRPSDNQLFTARFPDRESVDAYNNKFVVRTKTKLGLTTPAYKQFKSKYDKYVTEQVKKAYEEDIQDFKLNSFVDFVAQEQGSIQTEDILKQLNYKNINTNDNAFKRYLWSQTKKNNLKDLNGLERRELYRTIEALPTMPKKNTGIDEAFNKSYDNRQQFNKQGAIKTRTKELANKYSRAELKDLAIANGVSESFITDGIGDQNKETIARGIARQEINNQITAEEKLEDVSTRVLPNVQVRKVKTKAKDVSRGLQQYNVKYPDGFLAKTLIPAEINVKDAKDQAARQTFVQRIEALEKENKKTKTAPEASPRDYQEAVSRSLFKRTNPLAELRSIAGPQVKQSRTPAINTQQVEQLQQDAPLLEVPNMEGINYQGNLYKFNDNIDVPDLIMNLKRIVKRTMPNADITIVDRLYDPEGDEVAGVTLGDMIAINLETNPETGRPRFASPTDTVYHEAIHYFRNNGYFPIEVVEVLEENKQKIFDIATNRMQGEMPSTFEEALAIASGYYNEQKLQGRTPYEFSPPLRRFFEPIFKYFNQVAKFFSGRKYRKLEDVLDAVRTGDLYEDAVNNPKALTPLQQEYSEAVFKGTGYVGPYKGYSLTNGMNTLYDNDRNVQPFYSRTPAYGRNEIKISEIGVRVSRLNEAIKDTKTNSTLGKNWLNINKQGQYILAGSNIPFSKQYIQETRLDDWLNDPIRAEEKVTKEDIKKYIKANDGIISVVRYGGDRNIRLIASNQNEKEAIQHFNQQLQDATDNLEQTNKAIKSLFINRDNEYKALKEKYYDGPDDQASAAFYDLTRNLDEIQNIYKKLNINRKKEIEKNFNLLRNALNVETKSPDMKFSDTKSEQIETVINQLTLNGNILNNKEALRKVDPDGRLEKFLVGLENRYIVDDPLLNILDKIEPDLVEDDAILPYLLAEIGIEEVEGDQFFTNLNQLLNARIRYKTTSKLLFDSLYGDGVFDKSIPMLMPFGKTIQGDKPGFSIDTTAADRGISGEINMDRLNRLLFKAKQTANPNLNAYQLETLRGLPTELLTANVVDAAPTEAFLEDWQGKDFASQKFSKKIYTENKQEFLYTWNPVKTSGQFYVTDHYKGVDNVFVHMRTADVFVNDADGNLLKILYIDEIQSDLFADIQKSKQRWLEKLPEDDPRKEQGINAMSEADTIAAFKESRLKTLVNENGVLQIPLIGFPKPDFNAWQDFVLEEAVKIANNNAYDGISVATTEIQADRNTDILNKTFNYLSFYPSVDPADIYNNFSQMNTLLDEYVHSPTTLAVNKRTLIEEGYLPPLIDDVQIQQRSNQEASLAAAAQYFAEKLEPDSYEYNQYVTHVRTIGMANAYITQDLTMPITGSDLVYSHHPETNVNYLGNRSEEYNLDKEFGSLESVLPKDMADLIKDQIERGIKPQYKPVEINFMTPEEVDGRTLSTSRLLNRGGSRDAIGAGYINIAQLSPNQTQQFFAKSGWDIYSRDYPRKLQKIIKKLYGVEAESQGKSVKEIVEEVNPGESINDLQNKDYHANKLYDSPYDELIGQEKFTVDEIIFRTKYEIERRKGLPLLLDSAFRSDRAKKTAQTHVSRFNVPVLKFETTNQEQTSPSYKYSSTPSDAQRAGIWKRSIDFLGNIASSKYFSGLGAVPQIKEFMTLRYKTFGQIAKAEQTARDLYNDLGPYLNPLKTDRSQKEFQENRRQFTEYMEGGKKISSKIIKDEGLRKVAVKSKTAIDRIGRLLVRKGLLPLAKFEENEGSYLARLYLKHVLNYPNGQPLSYLKKRKDLSDETKVILGDIAELSPEYRVLHSINRPLRDMVILDFFNQVSQNQNWALRDGDMLIDFEQGGEVKKVSALWLMDESKRLREQADYFRSSEPDQAAQMDSLAKQYEQLAAPVLESIGYGEDNPTDDRFRRLPKTKKYGMLKGVAVRKEIYDDVVGTFTLGNTDNAYNRAIATMQKGTSIWKLLKVPLNPPTVVRNVGSNMILMNLVGGIPIHKVLPRMHQAIKQIQNDGKYWKIAQDFGIKSTGFSEQEMYRVSEEWIDLLQEQHALGDVTRFFAMPKILINKIFKKAGDVYQFTESVGKTAIIIDAMERQGMSDIDAFMLAQKSLFDYSDVPEAGRQFRKAPIGMPFFTFYYKALPALIETAINHPIRFAPYVALSAGLTALSAYAFGFEDDEEEKLQKGLEPWLEKRTGVYVLPWKDSDGRYQFLDIGYFFPWTMYTDLIKNVGDGDFFEAQRTTGLFSGPFADIFLAIKTNKDPFTQRTIWDERDPVEDRIQNIMWYMYSLGMPSWLTPNGAISKTTKALQDIPRPTGAPADTVPQALMRFLGVNVYGLDVKDTRIRNIKRMRQEILDIQQRFKYAMANKSYSEKKKERLRVRYMQMIKEKVDLLQQYKIDTSIPRHILERESKFQDG